MKYRLFEISIEKEDAFDNKKHLFCVANNLGIKTSDIVSYNISRRAIDARKKSHIIYKFNFDVEVKNGVKIYPNCRAQEIQEAKEDVLKIKNPQTTVVVGSGPSGLFCALTLARAGESVVLLERGKKIEEREKDVENLLKNGVFNKNSNIQFGEGGAGTFSDGKLNTGTNSPHIKTVLETFYRHGAPEDILFDAKPHIGTDCLKKVIVNMRHELENLGAKVLFESKFISFEKSANTIKVYYEGNGKLQKFECKNLVLALGYSARETFLTLYEMGLEFKQKPFSVGYRIEHKQTDINMSQFGKENDKFLPPADYKLFHHLENGRTVYTFCMCPGGVVVPAQSEEDGLCTNGMSYHARSGENANSAVLVSVSEKDYGSEHPLAGMFFQQKLEREAFEKGNGKYVISTFGDFEKHRASTSLGKVKPTIGINGKLGNCYELLPKEFADSIIIGIKEFGKKLKGFDSKDAVLTGIETRSSAPFMIERNENKMTNIENVFAIGEGAGRAGGIVSSAVDGIVIAKSIIENYGKEKWKF